METGISIWKIGRGRAGLSTPEEIAEALVVVDGRLDEASEAWARGEIEWIEGWLVSRRQGLESLRAEISLDERKLKNIRSAVALAVRASNVSLQKPSK